MSPQFLAKKLKKSKDKIKNLITKKLKTPNKGNEEVHQVTESNSHICPHCGTLEEHRTDCHVS